MFSVPQCDEGVGWSILGHIRDETIVESSPLNEGGRRKPISRSSHRLFLVESSNLSTFLEHFDATSELIH